MKILHYFLGFPPYRSGGLTRYAFDLAKAQVEDGHEVFAMWPGEIKKYMAEPYIKARTKICGIVNLEIINPLPVSLDEGINRFDVYMNECNMEVYLRFLRLVHPDIIHIHTLMGLHREFVQAAEQLGIKTVFTTHDYFGLCPKVTLYRFGECCSNDFGCKMCVKCNVNSLSLKEIQVMQSPMYRFAKDLAIVKKLRGLHRGKFYKNDTVPCLQEVEVERNAIEYRKLREYYVGILEIIDVIHFNSRLSEEIYKRYMRPKSSIVIPITHQGIMQHDHEIKMKKNKVILCLSPARPYKGWDILKAACDKLWSEGEQIELRVYSSVPKLEPYMVVNESGFVHSELKRIMSEADVLVAPSMWYETFGFTVLEALSYRVPVIVSNHVGAKDIVGDNGIIVEAGNINSLAEAIKNINIKVTGKVKDWNQFMAENYDMYGVK